jgi:inosine/xanthosine triphosphate pyrophosphatase family protein
MRLIYGTGNPAKGKHMQSLLSSLDVEIVGIQELSVALPDIDESGNDSLKNAIIKAKTCYSAMRQPVFSADSGLYFEEVPPEPQPGVHIRRVQGKNLTIAKRSGIFYTIHLDENLNPCDFNERVATAYAETVLQTIGIAKRLSAPMLNMRLSVGVYFTLPDKKVCLFDGLAQLKKKCPELQRYKGCQAPFRG